MEKLSPGVVASLPLRFESGVLVKVWPSVGGARASANSIDVTFSLFIWISMHRVIELCDSFVASRFPAAFDTFENEFVHTPCFQAWAAVTIGA